MRTDTERGFAMDTMIKAVGGIEHKLDEIIVLLTSIEIFLEREAFQKDFIYVKQME